MREFILRSLKSKTSPFDVNDLANAGRMDIVCDCISTALFTASDVRKDTIIHVILEGPSYPPKTISFIGNQLKNLDYDQKSIAQVINIALRKGINLKLNQDFDFRNGILVSKKSFEHLVKEKVKNSMLVYLNKHGEDIRAQKFQDNVTFIFGDYIGMPKKTEKLLERIGAKKIRLGPKMLFASHCITIVHNELDRAN